MAVSRKLKVQPVSIQSIHQEGHVLQIEYSAKA